MDFDFFNYTSKRSRQGRILVPMQRLLRRVLRPMLHRLRDLIAFVYHKHLEDRRLIQDLEHRISYLESVIHETVSLNRALKLDQTALIRKVAQLEDQLEVARSETDPSARYDSSHRGSGELDLDKAIPLSQDSSTVKPVRIAS